MKSIEVLEASATRILKFIQYVNYIKNSERSNVIYGGEKLLIRSGYSSVHQKYTNYGLNLKSSVNSKCYSVPCYNKNNLKCDTCEGLSLVGSGVSVVSVCLRGHYKGGDDYNH
jgi:hypothetical protein